MLVSYKWLKELVAIEATSHELAEAMSTTGIEVEGVEQKSAGLSKLVVGQIKETEAIPDTHLTICQVAVGEETRQIVCGAPNVVLGSKVIVALPGARIAGNYKIKKGKIRGVESMGMLCSLSEIGLSDSVVPKAYVDGIYHLPADARVGDPVFSYLDLDDEIIELSITPNRADALSMRGVAHEVAAIYGLPVQFPTYQLSESKKKASDLVSVSIQSDKAAHYRARVIEGVQIAPSPQWLQNRLMNAGIRPLNNVVDVTNYILLSFGQPMHAFDLDRFQGTEICARAAREGEVLVTLDDEERLLTTEDLVIAVGDQPVALAGVMGGAATEITDQSTRIVLEAAVFDGKSIRKTSSRLHLRSESSSRFEKGINLATVEEAMDTAAAMIADLAGGEVLSGTVAAGQLDLSDIPVTAQVDYVNRSLGTNLDYPAIASIFGRLGMSIMGDEHSFTVAVPRRRWDIRIPADLVEEIARIYGYNNLPTTLPKEAGTAGELTPSQMLRRQIRRLVEGAGLTEVLSYALTRPEKALAFSLEPSQLTELMWPMTEDRSVLRQNMVAGLLETVAYNVARKNKHLALYEIGKVFSQTGNPLEDLPQEKIRLAIALTGLVTEKDFQTPAVAVDFFHAKGIVEAIFAHYRLEVHFRATSQLASMHPGRTAAIYLGEQLVGFVGQVHPQTAKDYDIPETYVAEIDLDVLEQAIQPHQSFVEISKHPAVSRDIALLLDQDITHQQVIDAIDHARVKRLTKISLFDVYAGPSLGAGKKSMAYSLTFQHPSDSLTDEEVASYMDKIRRSLEELGAEIR